MSNSVGPIATPVITIAGAVGGGVGIAMGVIRHVDAGYDRAVEVAGERRVAFVERITGFVQRVGS